MIEKMERETGTRTRDVQLGKTTVNWKQRTLRFPHLVLAIENTAFSLCALFTALNGAQTEHTNGIETQPCSGLLKQPDKHNPTIHPTDS